MKRAIICSYRNIHPLLRISSWSSHFVDSTHFLKPAGDPRLGRLSSPEIGFLYESLRFFAKSCKKWDGDGDEYNDSELGVARRIEVVDIGVIIKQTAVFEMKAWIDAVSNELSKLRTGRALPGMLDHIMVETGGVKIPLNRMAVVSVLDPKTLSVTPYNPSVLPLNGNFVKMMLHSAEAFVALKELEKAIVSSPLGLTPKPDGERFISAIPPMTKENMQAVCKVVAKSAEDVKQRIRRSRQKALDSIKKSVPKKSAGKDKEKSKAKPVSGFSQDDAKRLEKEIEELTKKYTKSAEDICKAKEKEITSS